MRKTRWPIISILLDQLLGSLELDLKHKLGFLNETRPNG